MQASRYYKMYWIWIIFTSPNEYSLDRGLGLVAKGTNWFQGSIDVWWKVAFVFDKITLYCHSININP